MKTKTIKYNFIEELNGYKGEIIYLVENIIQSLNHKMYLQEVKKSTLSIFDDKRCYINETESKPWNY